MVECSLIIEEFTDRRDPIDGLDTDLTGLDVDYVCQNYGIEISAWAKQIIQGWPR